jgi:isoleucyl-tRNA synthetase
VAPFAPFITDAIYRNLRRDDQPLSIHLTDFPDLAWMQADILLDRRMQRVMRAVSLGRYLRNQANLKVRQPLGAAIVVSMDAEVRDDLYQMKEIIAEELNVKQVKVDENEEWWVQLWVKANFKVLGPKLGKRMKEAANLITALGYNDVKSLCEGKSLRLVFSDGNDFEITVNDVEIRREKRTPMAGANDQDITIALDLTITEDLEMEGWARELVNRVQNLRKEKELEVSDRIKISYFSPPPVNVAVDRFRDYIMGETLAEALTFCNDALPDWQSVPLGAYEARFAIAKC